MKRATTAGELLIFLSYLLLSILLTYPLVKHLADSVPMPVYIHDTPWVHYLWKQLWWLWYNKFSLVDVHELPTHVDYIFFPVGIKSAAYFFQCLIPSLLFTSLLLLTRDVAVAGNTLLILSLAASAYAAYLLAVYLLANRPAAYLSGLSFAFCSPQLGSAQGHLMILVSLPLIPLFILFLIKAAKEDRQINCYLLALSCVLLFLGYWYFFVCSALFAVIYLFLYPPQWNAVKRISLALAIASLFVIPVVVWILAQREIVYSAPLSVSQDWSVDLLAFLLPSADHPLFGEWAKGIRSCFLANPTIQSAYLNYPVVLACIYGLFGNRWKSLKLWLVSFFVFSVFALGPKLHILGQTVFHLNSQQFSIPLPFAILHRIPVVNAMRDCSMFLAFSTLAASMLAGFGFKALFEEKRSKFVFSVLLLILLFDFTIFPFPIHEFKTPAVYEQIGKYGGSPGTLVDVPLNPAIVSYDFYQTIHQKKVILGGFSRMPTFYQTYGDDLAIIGLFKKPEKITETYLQNAVQNRADATWAKNFFGLDTIVLHKNFLSPEQFARLDRFIVASFNVAEVLTEADGNCVGYCLGQMPPAQSLDKILVDFGARPPYHYIERGWSSREEWTEGLDVRWSDSSASELFLSLDDSSDYLASLRVSPFTYTEAPPQTISIYVNGHSIGKLLLAPDLRQYDFVVPSEQLVPGVNRLQFVYGYAKRPCEVVRGSKDERLLAVAFDYLSLVRTESREQSTESRRRRAEKLR